MRCAGLEFRLTASGARSWTFRFRDPVSRRTLRFNIGTYPDIGLSAARARADGLRSSVAAGINPIEVKRQEREQSTDRTIKALADRYLIEHAQRHKRARSAEEDQRNINKHVLPKWGKRDYRTIKRVDVVTLVEGIVAAGTHTAANRVQALISKMFSFAMDAGLIDANPAARLQKRGKENVGKRVLTDAEIVLFWRKIIQPPVSQTVGLALRLALLTAARESEIAGIAIDEIRDLDKPDAAGIGLSGERTKNKRPHFIPLTPLAVAVVKQAMVLIDDDAAYLFLSNRKPGKPIDRHSLPVAMSRFCAKQVGDGAAKSLRDDPPSPHDLRRTVGTRMAALGIPREDRDAVLNHARVDVGKHYDLYERAAEKRAALEKLSNEIGKLTKDRRG